MLGSCGVGRGTIGAWTDCANCNGHAYGYFAIDIKQPSLFSAMRRDGESVSAGNLLNFAASLCLAKVTLSRSYCWYSSKHSLRNALWSEFSKLIEAILWLPIRSSGMDTED
jgi:hypothetical protein